MIVASVRLPESLQVLIDSRLDTIDRMLLGRVPRADRLAIVKDVETQIFELLPEREGDELSREDVLAVLARLDPPEAYLPEEDGVGPGAGRAPAVTRPRSQVQRDQGPKVAKASGTIGLSALAVILLLAPMLYAVALLLESEGVLLVGGFGIGGLAFVGGLVSIVLGVHSRHHGIWAILGVVTGLLALLFTSAVGLYVLLLLVTR